MRVVNVVGARPNFMKIAPLIAEMRQQPHMEPILVHTGQHYDAAMSDTFFADLDLPTPDLFLGVGSGSHALQTASVMIAFESALTQLKPDLVVVVGDVNSTLACALVAAKMLIPLAHVEAGLRSFDRTMPEEINRLLTDALADQLFTTSEDANENLRREGIPPHKIHLVGNVMIDTLLKYTAKAEPCHALGRLNLTRCTNGPYSVLTLHRPSNVDDRESLGKIFLALEMVQRKLPILFPVHPRTARRLEEFGYKAWLENMRNLVMLPPLGYLDFLSLYRRARFVLTDSGGVQEETTVLGIPCLTLRENSERPVTITEGTNTLVGSDPKRIVGESFKILRGEGKRGKIPKLWDGKAAERIVKVLLHRET